MNLVYLLSFWKCKICEFQKSFMIMWFALEFGLKSEFYYCALSLIFNAPLRTYSKLDHHYKVNTSSVCTNWNESLLPQSKQHRSGWFYTEIMFDWIENKKYITWIAFEILQMKNRRGHDRSPKSGMKHRFKSIGILNLKGWS